MATYEGKRTLADGTTRHRFKVRRTGAATRVFSAPTKTAAKKAARAHEVEIDQGRAREGKATVGEAIDLYLDSEDFEALRDGERRRAMLEWWRGRAGKLVLRDLDAVADAVADGRDALRAGSGPGGKPATTATANRYQAALSKVFEVARDRQPFRRLLRFNPARQVRRGSESGNERTRVLADDEFWTLLEACRATGNRRLPVLYLSALSSGARKGELLALRRTELDLTAGTCPVWTTKSGRPRTLHFRGMALEALREYVRDTPPSIGGALFAASTGEPTFPRTEWAAALTAAGLAGEIVWHSLRHSSMTWAAILGATEPELMAHGGHRTSSQVARYTHLAEHRTSEVAGLLLPDFRGGRRAAGALA